MKEPRSASDDRTGGGPGRRWFWAGLVLGSPLVLIGMGGLLRDKSVSSPVSFGKWFVAGALIHDLAFAPAVLLAALVVRRLVPRRWLAAVLWPLALSGFVAIFAFIPLIGWGRSPGEPTVQPLNYPLGLTVILVAIWASAAIVAMVGVLRRRQRQAGPDGVVSATATGAPQRHASP